MKLKGLVPDTQPNEIYLAQPYWDYGTIVDGKKKVDPLLHYGCFTLGYNRHDIIDYVCEQHKTIKPEIAELAFMQDKKPRLNEASFELAEKIYKISNGYRSFYSLSGSDANEGAVKLAAAYHKTKGNTHKNIIVSFQESYHGSTFLTSSLGADNLMEDPFYTMEPYSKVVRIPRDFMYVPDEWNKVSCIVIETCSYGNDMDNNSNELWEKLSVIQKEHDVILIVDDVFMGGGKTGHYIGWKELPVEPDISTMGKAITGGTFPLSMVLYNDRIHKSLPADFKWDHGFTYNFSMPGVFSALKYIEILKEENILEKHDSLKDKATDVFKTAGFDILNTFGLHFMVKKDDYQMLYVIPLNATDEYFDVLLENLTS